MLSGQNIVIFQPETGVILSKENFTSEEREKVREVLISHGISPMVYSFVNGLEKENKLLTNKHI